MAGIMSLAVTLNWSAAAQTPPQPVIVDGYCEPVSWLAAGPPGSDFSRDKPRFFCDGVVVAYFDQARRHMMVQFMGSRQNHGQIIAFAGWLERDRLVMNVDRVYLEPNKPTEVSGSACRLFWRQQRLTGVTCGARIDAVEQSTAVVLAFEARR